MKHPETGIPTDWLQGVDPSSQEVFQAFRRAMLGYRHLMHRLFANEGTHPGQAAVLGMLSPDERISQCDLAEKLHVSPPTVTALLHKLEKSGAVARETDAEDQRVTRIHLTEEGCAARERVQTTFVALIEAGLGSMSEKDRIELARLLNMFGENISRAL